MIAFDFHVTERFKHFVEGREIFAIARFISCREYDVGDRPGQLDVSDALPLGIRFRGRIFVDETGLSVAGFSGIDFLFGFAVYLFHLLDRRGDKLLNILYCVLAILAYMICVCIGPGRSFRVQNAWQSLLDSDAVVENPPSRRIDLKRGFGAVNDSARMRLLRESASAKNKIVFMICAQFEALSVQTRFFSLDNL